MTEKQKKLAIIAGTVVIALILLLSFRSKGNGAINNKQIVNQAGVEPINVSIPSMNIPQRSPIAINIPALPSMSPYAFSAISPCMCNGAGTVAPIQQNPLVTFVTNQANSGPNIYNYYEPEPYRYVPSDRVVQGYN
jgi:hypothetical protein